MIQNLPFVKSAVQFANSCSAIMDALRDLLFKKCLPLEIYLKAHKYVDKKLKGLCECVKSTFASGENLNQEYIRGL